MLLCWLALLLIRVADRTDLTWRRIALELGRLHAVTLVGTAGSVTQTTPLSEAAAGILKACQVDPPPRVTTLQPRLTSGLTPPRPLKTVGTRLLSRSWLILARQPAQPT